MSRTPGWQGFKLFYSRDLIIQVTTTCLLGFPCNSAGKESTCNAGDPCSIPGSERSPGEGICYPLQYSWASLVPQLGKNPQAMWSIPGLGRFPGEGGYPLQCSGLENSMDCIVHEVAKSWTD